MNSKIILFLLFQYSFFYSGISQKANSASLYTKADTLRGSIGSERNWWDVQHYAIHIQPDYATKSLKGSIQIQFKVTRNGELMQIDLQEPLILTKASYQKQSLAFSKMGNVYFLHFPKPLQSGKTEMIQLEWEGNPIIAKLPPWDGGWIFRKDEKGRPWMSVACQGLGASAWYPCKDHQSDEPNLGASLSITVSDTLMAVANGRLIEEKKHPNRTKTYTWEVKNPINNYLIVPYIGKYVNWKEDYLGEKGKLTCNYWVLDYELEKAKQQFKQVPLMLKSFEYWMGPYPFYEDGYQIVQAPHLGMEHQSAIAYGNRFANGYLGKDLSGTGWGLLWDFILVHESGHEWFANNITSGDIADMWIHESFTNYSETLFTEFWHGISAANEYNFGTRNNIQNDKPIIADYGVNRSGSGDMYAKGGNLLHTLRHVMNNDVRFREMLRFLNKKYYHSTVTTHDIEKTMSEFFSIPLKPIFDQYLRTTLIPIFEYKISNDKQTLSYRYKETVPGFNLPLHVNTSKGNYSLEPRLNEWQILSNKWVDINDDLLNQIEKNYYVKLQNSTKP